MPFIPVENTAHVRLEGRVDNQQTINDLYFRHTTGAIAAADLSALGGALASWLTGTLTPLLNEAYSPVKVTARDLTSAVGFVYETGLAGASGGVAGEAAPNNCSMAVSFRTAFAGRNFRGRNYVPCLTNSQVTGNNIDADWAASIVDAYADLLFGGAVLPAGWIWVIVSRFTAGAPRVAGVFNEVFSVLVSDLIVDSMRTRLPGRGN